MPDERISVDIEIGSDEDELEPLLPADAEPDPEDVVLEFDEAGTLVRPIPGALVPQLTTRPPIGLPELPLIRRPCPRAALNGSWLIEITPEASPIIASLTAIRGPMRIEARDDTLRVSGDIYVRRQLVLQPTLAAHVPDLPLAAGSLVIKKNWYPAFPQSQYRWYFRSLGVTYHNGTMTFNFERHLWNAATQEFTSQDTGSMTFSCNRTLVKPPGAPRRTLQMKGTATIGGRPYKVTATKTSPYYRGCLVEADVMTNRSWPSSAASCDGSQTFTFTGVYRAAGLDFRAVVNEVNVPQDPLLTIAEMHTLLATHRSLSAGGDNWHLWLLVGSRVDGTLGIMFDTGTPPHREGAAGFYDPTLPNSTIIEQSARGQKLGDVPLAFLRTLVHEAGHAFNLFHPKHDVHSPPVGTTIMNQTGDVMGFATAANPYPCNASMAFDEHNRTSLVHSPDPQVKPGWKEFGWGHSTTWTGIAEPVDALGLRTAETAAGGLRLDLELPDQAHRGEFVAGTATVTNTGDTPRAVTAALNLSEGDLWLSADTPAGDRVELRDVVIACGVRRFVELQPGESISGQLQLFYTAGGFTFDQPGTYTVQAELDVGDVPENILRSEPAHIVIRPAATDEEQELESLTLDTGVGLALAIGDSGAEPAAQEKLEEVLDRFPETETGAASAMVVVNSVSRDLRNVRSGEVLRPADDALVARALEIATRGDAVDVARRAAAVVSPIERESPLLDRVERLLEEDETPYSKKDRTEARKILEDHAA